MDILQDKQYKDYSYLSRYNAFPNYYHTIDRKFISGVTSHLNKDCSYMLYKTKQGDTLDTIALDFYNNPTYFWVIADFNNILDPYKEISSGIEIKVPVLNEISFKD